MTDENSHDRLHAYIEKIIAWHDRYWQAQVESLRCKMMTELAQRDKALQLQAEANKVHFDNLNHEAVRILEQSMRTVSADTWRAFERTDTEWKSRADRKLQEAVTREDFNDFRKTTDRSFSMQEGAFKSRSRAFAIIAAIAGVIAVISGTAAIWTFIWSLPKGIL